MIVEPAIQALRGTADGTGAGLPRSENQCLHPRMHHGADTHGARLERYVERCTREPIIAHPPRRLPQRDDLGMGRRIRGRNYRVAALTDYLTLSHQHGAHWHFTVIAGSPSPAAGRAA